MIEHSDEDKICYYLKISCNFWHYVHSHDQNHDTEQNQICGSYGTEYANLRWHVLYNFHVNIDKCQINELDINDMITTIFTVTNIKKTPHTR